MPVGEASEPPRQYSTDRLTLPFCIDSAWADVLGKGLGHGRSSAAALPLLSSAAGADDSETCSPRFRPLRPAFAGCGRRCAPAPCRMVRSGVRQAHAGPYQPWSGCRLGRMAQRPRGSRSRPRLPGRVANRVAPPCPGLLTHCYQIIRMGARVVEGTGLENRQARERLVGSNPTPSAIISMT